MVRGPRRSTDALTDRQRQILTVIQQHRDEHGYPPSLREIGAAVGLSSPSSVHAQLATLERKGFLRRDPAKPRALEVRPRAIAPPAPGGTPAGVPSGPERTTTSREAVREVPLLGEIAAGAPVIAEEHVEARVPLPREVVGDGRLFMLRVRGDSMVDAGVLADDLVVVRQQDEVEQGELCAALIEGEATVKRFRRTATGEVFLDPANPAYQPIPVTADQSVRVMGRVVAVLRSL